MDLTHLNDQQREAVMHQHGPCLVLATAGSGKTACLTLRAARLIEDGVDPERLLLATFTRKAAEEMRTRIAAIAGNDVAQRMWINTVHSHCLRMLKASYHECGLPPFELINQYECIRLAREILAPSGMNWNVPAAYPLTMITRARADLAPVEERWFREHTDSSHINDLVAFWQRYDAVKQVRRLMDFDDLLIRLRDLWTERPDVLRRWQDAFDWIMEDEVQDTTIAQHAIISALANRHQNYFAVGDVAQCIYGFRGSNPTHTIMSFRSQYPDGRIIKLSVNYRSQREIVDRATRLIRHNHTPREYTVEPIAHRDHAGEIEHMFAWDEVDEAARVVVQIRLALDDESRPSDIAILYRINAQSLALEDALVSAGIPYVVRGSCGFYERKEIKDILAYLVVANNPDTPAADDALIRIINIASPSYARDTRFLGKAFVEHLTQLAVRTGCSRYSACLIGNWPLWQREAVCDLKYVIDRVRQAGRKPAQMIRAARRLGYDNYLLREDGLDTGEGTPFDNLDALMSVAMAYDNVDVFLAHVTQQQSRRKTATTTNAVTLSTIHSAKGLEWPVVVIAGLSLNLLPHYRSCRWFDPAHKRHLIPESIHEERRLCYVAVTRAKNRLIISTPLAYLGRALQWSPFMTDMGFSAPPEFAEHEAKPSVVGVVNHDE